MRPVHPARALAIFAVIAVLGVACGGAAPGPTDGADGAGEGAAELRVGMALDVGGLNDKSFNDAANRGLQQAISEGLVTEENTQFLEANQTGSNRDENLTSLAEEGYDIIIAVGYAFSEHVAELAPEFPELNFAVIDGFTTAIAEQPNVADLTFKEQEGSFLVGAAAGLKTETQTVGFLGGAQGQGVIEKFQAGYEAGVAATCADCEVLVEYIGETTQAFFDRTRGEILSEKLYDQGADIVYHAAGQSGLGLFKEAVEQGPDALAIGVDSDQYLTASPEEKPHIMTSMLKRVDTAVLEVIRDQVEGNFPSGFHVFGLADEGIDYATTNPDLLTPDIQAQLDTFKEQIINGEITVPEEPQG
jgi:basic membrane protein A